MNELMITTRAGHIYFETEKGTAENAFMDFERVCYDNGINIDNFLVMGATLRDSNYNDIDSVDYF